MDDRRDSDWYRTAKLFRQWIAGDWTEVTRKLTIELQHFREGGGYRVSRDLPIAKSQCSHKSVLMPSFHPPKIPSELSSIGEMREGIFEILQQPDDVESVALAWYGEWHHEQLALLARLVKLGQVIVEVGSSVGVHAVALSRLVGPEGHLLVFERVAKTVES